MEVFVFHLLAIRDLLQSLPLRLNTAVSRLARARDHRHAPDIHHSSREWKCINTLCFSTVCVYMAFFLVLVDTDTDGKVGKLTEHFISRCLRLNGSHDDQTCRY